MRTDNAARQSRHSVGLLNLDRHGGAFVIDHARSSEADVQAELYMAAKQAGLDLKLEINLGKNYLSADAAFYDSQDRIYALVEVKRSVGNGRTKTQSRQYKKYEASGLPWRYCLGRDQIKDTIQWVIHVWTENQVNDGGP